MKSMSMKNLKKGYYCVKLEGMWVIARYCGENLWLYVGTNEYNHGEGISEIGQRLTFDAYDFMKWILLFILFLVVLIGSL